MKTIFCLISAIFLAVELPAHQVLIYPVADATNLSSPSYEQFAEAKPLNKAMMSWFYTQIGATPQDARSI